MPDRDGMYLISIAKPFTPDELLETVRQVIQKKEHYGKKENYRSPFLIRSTLSKIEFLSSIVLLDS